MGLKKTLKKIAKPASFALNPIGALSYTGAKQLFKKPGEEAPPGPLSDPAIAAIVGDPARDSERIKATRKQYLDEMASMLSTQRDQSFKRAIPMLAEDANVKGIYSSTGFGDSLARQYRELEQDAQNNLTQAGLATGNDALQRELSLEDFGRDIKASSMLGSQFAPKVQKPGKVGPALQGAVGGGAAGSAFGPWGAGIGAGLGAIGGSASAKGK